MLSPSVHDWDGDYSVSVFTAATGVDNKSFYKQRALEGLLKVLPQWANNTGTFEDDVALEISDAGRIPVDSYAKKAARLMVGDFSALANAPINASIVEMMRFVADVREAYLATIGGYFRSAHFAAVPGVQLSARLFSAYKGHLRLSRTPPDPTSKKTRTRLSGFFYDIQHAATYGPYCDGYLTDNAMATLMKDGRVKAEDDFGCKVFSSENMDDFIVWLDGIKSRMTRQHADDLSLAYPRRFGLAGEES